MRNIFIILVTIIALASCATYYIPVNSLKDQFADIDSTKLIEVTVEGPVYGRYHYLANPIDTIRCVDKNGDLHLLTNSPSIETRFTYGHKNEKVIFYFDRIYVNSNSVIGVQSRFMEAIGQSIPLDSITKIEIQDGRKKFKYIR